MTVLQALVAEFNTFKPGTRARAMVYLRTGVLAGDAHHTVQARLDHWVHRMEQVGPNFRRAILRALRDQSDAGIAAFTQDRAERAAV